MHFQLATEMLQEFIITNFYKESLLSCIFCPLALLQIGKLNILLFFRRQSSIKMLFQDNSKPLKSSFLDTHLQNQTFSIINFQEHSIEVVAEEKVISIFMICMSIFGLYFQLQQHTSVPQFKYSNQKLQCSLKKKY